MKKAIKYKREEKEFSNRNEIQAYFDELVTRNYEILYYSEIPKGMSLGIVVVLVRSEKED